MSGAGGCDDALAARTTAAAAPRVPTPNDWLVLVQLTEPLLAHLDTVSSPEFGAVYLNAVLKRYGHKQWQEEPKLVTLARSITAKEQLNEHQRTMRSNCAVRLAGEWERHRNALTATAATAATVATATVVAKTPACT